MSEDPLLPQILILLVLIFLNAFFAAAEIALISLSEGKIRKQAEDGDRAGGQAAEADPVS